MDNLPLDIVDEIINHVEDARDIAKLSVTCKSFQEAGYDIRSMHVKVLNEDHERVRNPVDMSSPNSGLESRNLKDTVVNITSKRRCLKQLCIEVEPRLQSKEVPENEGQKTDFWMSDPYFVRKWLPRAGATLQHLCIVDYGKQAMMRRSSILNIVSENLEIRIVAPQLKSLAFNMKVSEQSSLRVCSEDTCEEHATKVMPGGLLEILYGASSFEILAILIARNMRTLKKLCWDIPCMELNEDGTFCKVLTDVPLNLPSFEHLHNCERLQSLYIGPGLWYSMETHVNQLAARNRWPRMHTLVVHMIPHDTGSSIRVLQMILGPSVKHLTIYIHKSGPVDSMLIKQRIKESDMQGIDCIVKECSTSHDFTYFSF